MGDLQAEELVSFISERTRLEPDRVVRILYAGILDWVSTVEPSDNAMLSFANMIVKDGKPGIAKNVFAIQGAAIKSEETFATVWEVTQALLVFLGDLRKPMARSCRPTYYEKNGRWHFDILLVSERRGGVSINVFKSEAENKLGYETKDEATKAALAQKTKLPAV